MICTYLLSDLIIQIIFQLIQVQLISRGLLLWEAYTSIGELEIELRTSQLGVKGLSGGLYCFPSFVITT